MDKHIEEIIETFTKINKTSKKNSEKIVFQLIKEKQKIKELIEVLKNLDENILECNKCFYFKFNDLCESCENPNRDITKICVVSNILDAKTIIDKEVYNGTFYILNGEININSGVLPENLNVDKLFDKIKVGNELLLALNTTFEGEVTSNYIANKLQGKNIKITRLAKGMPIGGVIDYIDKETLKSAFDYRKDFKE